MSGNRESGRGETIRGGKDLYGTLCEYAKADYLPMHMPGHKRNPELFGESGLSLRVPYSMDITEIDGFDNLHLPEGILKEAMERAARVFRARRTFFLVNGSTCGLLAAISACVGPGERFLMARNCHKAVYNAVYLRRLCPVYLYPEEEPSFGICGRIDPEKVREAFCRYPDMKAAVITSPTYEGIVSDIAAIARIVHEAGAVLIVDEAHGAHLGFGHGFPGSAVKLGADLVIQSVHKTLPSPTQTALLHVCGDRVREEQVGQYLAIYQSSSPSYILMAGIDRCVGLLEERGEALFAAWEERLREFYGRAKEWKRLRLYREASGFDVSKLVISVRGTALSGGQLYEKLLADWKIQPEMASKDYIICMSGMGDTDAGMRRLSDALLAIDRELREEKIAETYGPAGRIPEGIIQAPEHHSWEMPAPGEGTDRLPLSGCEGKISAEYVYLYPPGIPILVPGEPVTKETLSLCAGCIESGLKLRGMRDLSGNCLETVRTGGM